jgi:creatinine amidohydrolase
MSTQTLLLEEMSWLEIKEALAAGYDRVIITAASVEQHGPHMAEITDTVLGYECAIDLARRLGNTLVAPVIRPALSAHHLALPGSITLRPEIFRGVVEDYVAAYVRHGFKTLILISSHGGNFKALEEIAGDLANVYPDVKIIFGFGLSALTGALPELEREAGLPEGACGGHACAWETSEMLHFAPRLVHMEKAETGHMGEVSPALLEKFFKEGVTAVTPNGILGDAKLATPELGVKLFKVIQDRLEAEIRKKL